METSNSYVAIEQMIHLGEVKLSELEHLLDSLRRQEQITTLEHETLLELTWNKSILKSPAL
ncbi:MAG TPA: hypothetical protein VK897_14495 [Anaerolineales bacterium]|nr:hypothetical protein [Anaerolineales bacterium]